MILFFQAVDSADASLLSKSYHI